MAFDLVVNDNLGLMIRGGIEYGLGIFITGVDQESAAFRNGLRVSLVEHSDQSPTLMSPLVTLRNGYLFSEKLY